MLVGVELYWNFILLVRTTSVSAFLICRDGRSSLIVELIQKAPQATEAGQSGSGHLGTGDPWRLHATASWACRRACLVAASSALRLESFRPPTPRVKCVASLHRSKHQAASWAYCNRSLIALLSSSSSTLSAEPRRVGVFVIRSGAVLVGRGPPL